MIRKEYLQGRIVITVGDITTWDADVIVNAANPSLMGGGGVDGAIHRAGGSKILEECKEIQQELYPDGLPVGEAVVTTAGNMRAKYVIHTVGPVWCGGDAGESEKLKKCYLNSLKVAENENCKTIAFPAISTGVYGYPKKEASVVVNSALSDYFRKSNSPLDKIYLIFFDGEDFRLFTENCSFEFPEKA